MKIVIDTGQIAQKLKHSYNTIKNHWSTWAITLCIAAQTCDVVSSVWAAPKTYEANPFVRHANGQFWLSHGILLKLYFLVEFTLIALGFYVSLKKVNQRLAKLSFLAPYLYLAFIAFDAAASNLLYHTGWYIPLNW